MISRLPPDLERELRRLIGCWRTGDDPWRRLPLAIAPRTARALRGRRVLITGGGGSIGAPLARALAGFGARVATLDKDEHALARLATEETARVFLADLRQRRRLDAVLGEFRPELVMHAAAHKHLPLLEDQGGEAMANNAAATDLLCRAAVRAGVARLVLLSTDKAAAPSSALGASKRAAERIVAAHARGGQLETASARLANVLGSRGSVLEFWWQAWRAGRPLPLTDRRMARRFLTLQASLAWLLELAAGPCLAGEVFVPRRAPEVGLHALARTFLAVCGDATQHWIEIGARPGERLRERLMSPAERRRARPDRLGWRFVHPRDERRRGPARLER